MIGWGVFCFCFFQAFCLFIHFLYSGSMLNTTYSSNSGWWISITPDVLHFRAHLHTAWHFAEQPLTQLCTMKTLDTTSSGTNGTTWTTKAKSFHQTTSKFFKIQLKIRDYRFAFIWFPFHHNIFVSARMKLAPISFSIPMRKHKDKPFSLHHFIDCDVMCLFVSVDGAVISNFERCCFPFTNSLERGNPFEHGLKYFFLFFCYWVFCLFCCLFLLFVFAKDSLTEIKDKRKSNSGCLQSAVTCMTSISASDGLSVLICALWPLVRIQAKLFVCTPSFGFPSS